MTKSGPGTSGRQIGGVHHLAVVVRDLTRAERFYRRLFGLRVLQRWKDERGRPRAVWLALDDRVFLAIERAGRPGPRRADVAPGWHCVALAIDRTERDFWRRRLARAGVAIERETAYTLFVRDPDGNLLGLSHYPEAV
jgi:catechol 2,3-dioxygenase-like lactoylglutathione lyase family enzyme